MNPRRRPTLTKEPAMTRTALTATLAAAALLSAAACSAPAEGGPAPVAPAPAAAPDPFPAWLAKVAEGGVTFPDDAAARQSFEGNKIPTCQAPDILAYRNAIAKTADWDRQAPLDARQAKVRGQVFTTGATWEFGCGKPIPAGLYDVPTLTAAPAPASEPSPSSSAPKAAKPTTKAAPARACEPNAPAKVDPSTGQITNKACSGTNDTSGNSQREWAEQQGQLTP